MRAAIVRRADGGEQVAQDARLGARPVLGVERRRRRVADGQRRAGDLPEGAVQTAVLRQASSTSAGFCSRSHSAMVSAFL
jgi:hypothetical protein